MVVVINQIAARVHPVRARLAQVQIPMVDTETMSRYDTGAQSHKDNEMSCGYLKMYLGRGDINVR